MSGGILFVDDNQGDCDLMRVALDEVGFRGPLTCEIDALKALEQLRAPGAALPSLLLLDLNMPRMHGTDVLRALRADPRFAGVRIVVFTTSSRAADRSACLALGADDYQVKPADFAQLLTLAERIARDVAPA